MRYRVLYDLDHAAATGERAKPCGVVLDEGRDGVRIIAPWEKALPERVNGELVAGMKMDMSRDLILPGHPSYFGEVTHDLSRVFAMSEEYDTEQPEDPNLDADGSGGPFGI